MTDKPTPAQDAPVTETPAPAAEPSLAEQLGINPDVASTHPDSDEARLLSALADVDAEGAAPVEGATQQPDATQQQPDASQQQPQQPGQMPTVPLSVARDEREKRRNLELELAAERARSQTLEQLVLRGAITPEHARAIEEGRAAPTPQQQDPFADVNARELALAQQYENGEISYVDLKKGEQLIAQERRQVEGRVSDQRARDRAIEQSAPATQQIEQVFPSIEKLSQAQLDACAPLARQRAQIVLQSKGVKEFDVTNPAHLKIFHFHVAHLADLSFNGGRDFAAYQASRSQPTGQPPTNGTGQQPQTPSVARTPVPGRVTDPAQLVRDKVQLAGRIAPDTTGIRDQNHQAPLLGEERVLAMTTEDVAKMPKEVLDQMLGLT